MSNNKKKTVRPPRDMLVPLMRNRNGGGRHLDRKKQANRDACRNRDSAIGNIFC